MSNFTEEQQRNLAQAQEWLHSQREDGSNNAGPGKASTNGDGTDAPKPKRSGKRQTRQNPEHSIAFAEQQTDLANARRFIELYGDRILYCHLWRKWLPWDVCRWKVDDDGAAMRLAKAVADDVWNQARKTGDRGALQHAAKTASDKGAKALLSLAQSDVPVLPAELDANHWLLNCPNGTVDLRTGKLRDHRREDRITKLCPTAFDPAATSECWERFLKGVFGSEEIIAFVQRLFGMSLTGEQREQILPIFWGDGSNGKSTLLNAFMEAVGDEYSMQAAPDLLMAKRGESHPTDKADLFGRRIVSCVETDEGRRLSESLVKVLTGGEKVRARRMREDFWQFEPTHTVFLVTNHKPEVRGDDHAIWRRLALIPFVVRFWNPDKGETGPAELKQDKALPEKLKAEAAGILAWAVRGCIDWQKRGLRIPDEVRAATSEYQTEQDRIAAFIDELCITGSPSLRCRAGQLYSAYKRWAEDSGEHPITMTRFGKRMKARDSIETERTNGVWYVGIGLRDDGNGQ